MTTHLIEVGDSHINSTVGLCAPGINLDDGGTYHLNRTQQWLWRCWIEFWQECAQLPGRKIVCFKGDLGELDTKRRSVQIITANKAVIVKLAQRTIEPAVECADQMIFIRGTQAHEGKGAWLEELIADDYDHTLRDKDTGRASWYHIRPTIEDVRWDISHHANLSGIPWSRGNSANNLAHRIVWLYMVDMGQPPPDIASRAHNHRLATSNGFPTLVSFGNAWTAATEYAYRSGYENTIADIGGIVWTLEDGSYDRRVISFKPAESKRIWALKI